MLPWGDRPGFRPGKLGATEPNGSFPAASPWGWGGRGLQPKAADTFPLFVGWRPNLAKYFGIRLGQGLIARLPVWRSPDSWNRPGYPRKGAPWPWQAGYPNHRVPPLFVVSRMNLARISKIIFGHGAITKFLVWNHNIR